MCVSLCNPLAIFSYVKEHLPPRRTIDNHDLNSFMEQFWFSLLLGLHKTKNMVFNLIPPYNSIIARESFLQKLKHRIDSRFPNNSMYIADSSFEMSNRNALLLSAPYKSNIHYLMTWKRVKFCWFFQIACCIVVMMKTVASLFVAAEREHE